MKLAIVGSRDFRDQALLDQTVDDFLIKQGCMPVLVVSGGARGADTLAEHWARKHKILLKIFKPDWKAKGKAAGILRNTDIVNECTHMIAFPSDAGRGTQDSIKKALAQGKEVMTIWISDKKGTR
jgi:hypothetical protein